MIASKIVPAFYIIKLDGKAVESVIPGKFGISKITIGSGDFSNDLDATAALSTAMQFIANNPDLNLIAAKEKVEYNPEFFPMLRPLVLTSEQKKQKEEVEKQVTARFDQNSEVVVPITRYFDELGDFVQSRWTIDSEEFSLLGKVVINPDAYMKDKFTDAQNQIAQPMLKSERAAKVSIH